VPRSEDTPSAAREGLGLLVQPVGLRDQQFTLGGQRPGPGQAVEQPQTQGLLQRLHPPRHRGVLHLQPPRRAREAAGAGQFQKVADVIPLHGGGLSATSPGLICLILHIKW
jgi:hypothetical protein